MRKIAGLAGAALVLQACGTVLLVPIWIVLGPLWGLAALAFVAGLASLVYWIHRPGGEGTTE